MNVLLFLEFFTHQFCINQWFLPESFSWWFLNGEFLILPFFLHLFIIILYFIIICFVAVPDLASRSPFKLIFVPFWLVPSFFEYCLGVYHNKMFRLILYFPSLSPGMSYFFKKLWFLLVENGFKSCDLDCRCPRYCWVTIAPVPLGRHVGNRCMWYMCVCPHTVSTSSLVYWKHWVYTDTSDCSQSCRVYSVLPLFCT